MVSESSDANIADEASISMTSLCKLPLKRVLSGGNIRAVNISEGLSEISNIDIKRARKRALSGQHAGTS